MKENLETMLEKTESELAKVKAELAAANEELRQEKGLKTKLRSKDSLLNAIQENFPDGILVINENGTPVYYNKRFLEMWGMNIEWMRKKDPELIGMHVRSQLDDNAFTEFINKVEYLYSHPDEVSVDFIPRLDGRVYWRHSFPSKSDGKYYGRTFLFRDITERIMLENELKTSELKYRQLFENFYDIYFKTDRNSKIELLSPSVQRLMGYEPDELIGKSAYEFYVNPKQRDVLMSQIRENGYINNFETQLRTKNGEIIWASANAKILLDEKGEYDGTEGVFRDVTPLKQNEKKLIESERKFKQLVEDMGPDSVIFSHRFDGTLIYASPSLKDLIGIEKENILGKKWQDVIDWAPESRASGLKDSQDLIDGKKQYSTNEYSFYDKEGSLRTLYVQERRVGDAKGRFRRIDGLATDITARKKMEVEKEVLIKDLQDALENIKTLSGLLPICASCKKIRDDKGYWNQIESYIQHHSEAEFSHSMCPECSEKFYGNQDWYIKLKKKKRDK